MPSMQSHVDAVHARRGHHGNQRSDCFLPSDVFRPYADLDGTEARRFLERNGYRVESSGDAGTNGIAVTTCGWRLSTNGHLSWRPSNHDEQAMRNAA